MDEDAFEGAKLAGGCGAGECEHLGLGRSCRARSALCIGGCAEWTWANLRGPHRDARESWVHQHDAYQRRLAGESVIATSQESPRRAPAATCLPLLPTFDDRPVAARRPSSAAELPAEGLRQLREQSVDATSMSVGVLPRATAMATGVPRRRSAAASPHLRSAHRRPAPDGLSASTVFESRIDPPAADLPDRPCEPSATATGSLSRYAQPAAPRRAATPRDSGSSYWSGSPRRSPGDACQQLGRLNALTAEGRRHADVGLRPLRVERTGLSSSSSSRSAATPTTVT